MLLFNGSLDRGNVGGRLVELRRCDVEFGFANRISGGKARRAFVLEFGQRGARLGGGELRGLHTGVEPDEKIAGLDEGPAFSSNFYHGAIGIGSDGDALNGGQRADGADDRLPRNGPGLERSDGAGRHLMGNRRHFLDLNDLDRTKRDHDENEAEDGDEKFIEHGG